MAVVEAWNDLQVALETARDPAFAVDHLRKLAQSHAMHDRDRQATDAAAVVLGIENRTVNVESVRVGTVQQHDLLAFLGTGGHEVVHGDVVGIISETYVLDIDDQHVETVHRLIGRSVTLAAVERQDRDTCFRVSRTADMLAGVRVTSETMLRGEDSLDIHSLLHEKVKQMRTVDTVFSIDYNVSDNAAHIAEYGDSLAFEHRNVYIASFVTKDDAVLFDSTGTGQGGQNHRE